MKVGDKVRIIKKTFLHQGVIVHTNSLVEVVDIKPSVVTVVYIDKEGGAHYIQLGLEDVQMIEKENGS